jgi:hypothetical protein
VILYFLQKRKNSRRFELQVYSECLQTRPSESSPSPPGSFRTTRTTFSAALELETKLRQTVGGEVRFDDASPALYSTDASNYRQIPIGLVIPKTIEDVVAVMAACRQFSAPVLSLGGGTSLAGQCCNVAVIIDFSKYLNGITALDPSTRRASVEPGIVLDALRH